MEIVLGLGSALTYGAADFFGGLASRRTPVPTVVALAQLVGSVLLLAVWPLMADGAPDRSALAWGLVAGASGTAGVSLLYLGLAAGPMSVVAPVTAVLAAVVPVGFGLASGERPGPLALLGVVVALAAIVLVSLSGDGPRGRQAQPRSGMGVMAALGAGTAFGAFFIALERTPAGSGLWPLATSRVASLALIGLVLLLTATSLRPVAGTGPHIVLAGVLDVAANVLYLLAIRRGLLTLVAVLTSLYPASTVVLARFVLGERLTRVRIAGLAAAALGVVLIAA